MVAGIVIFSFGVTSALITYEVIRYEEACDRIRHGTGRGQTIRGQRERSRYL
jgi:hypothetical protein